MKSVKIKIIWVMSTIMFFDIGCHFINYRIQKEKKISAYLEKSDDVQSLLHYAAAILSGYTEGKGGEGLTLYNEGVENADKVHVRISLKNLDVDGKRGYMDVDYGVTFYDSAGEIIMSSGSDLSRWFIEKNKGDWRWKVVSVLETP